MARAPAARATLSAGPYLAQLRRTVVLTGSITPPRI